MFGVGDFAITMTVRGRDEKIDYIKEIYEESGTTRFVFYGYGALFIRSGEAGPPYSGPTVFIHTSESSFIGCVCRPRINSDSKLYSQLVPQNRADGDIEFRIRADEPFKITGALPNPGEARNRSLSFSRVGNKLIAIIEGQRHEMPITKDLTDSNKQAILGSPLRFRGNHVHPEA